MSTGRNTSRMQKGHQSVFPHRSVFCVLPNYISFCSLYGWTLKSANKRMIYVTEITSSSASLHGYIKNKILNRNSLELADNVNQ